jgi:hypothetical protein
MAKKVKIVRKVKSKIKSIKPLKKDHTDKPQALESAISEEQAAQFSEFISTGVAPSPTLETGQAQQQPLETQVPSTPSSETSTEPTQLYETNPSAIAEDEGLGKTYQSTPTMTLEKTQNLTPQRSASQGSSNLGGSSELAALRGQKRNQGEKAYDASELSTKPSEQRRRAWEGG